MSAEILPLREGPRPTRCGNCGRVAAEAICSLCKTERPALTALKSIAKTASACFGVRPVTEPLPPCRYEPKALCDCGGRGLCLPAA